MNAQQIQTVARAVRTAGMMTIALATLSTAAYAQGGQPAAPATSAGPRGLSVSILHLNVASLKESLAFYHDVLGMELTAPLAPPRAGGALMPDPGAMLQTSIVKVPGGTFSMELVEWTGTALRPQHPRIQDPGQIMLAFNVRDMEAKIAGAKKLGLRVLTKDGVPYVTAGRQGGQNIAIMIQDPSGFIVELTDITANPTANTAAPPGPITGVTVYLTVQDLAQTVNFYNRSFGFTMMAPAAAGPANDRIKGLFGDPSLATMRTARGTFPGSEFTLNFQEFTGPDRKPVHHRVQDPGGPIFTMTVQDFPAVIDLVRANGGTIGDGDTSAALAPNATASWVRDPNGLLLRLSVPQPARGAAGPVAAAPARP